jgi:nuclease S1
VLKAAGNNVQNAATMLLAAVTTEQIHAWTQSDPRQWANESFGVTESVQTKYCVKHGNSCDKPSGSVRIDQAYIDANVPIVKKQPQKAGIRLAGLLDKALATRE